MGPKFKSGDRVKMLDGTRYAHGEVTIVRTNNHMIKNILDEAIICKVLFDKDYDPDYWYYPENELEIE